MRLKRIAHYDVTALLGEGGMGEVCDEPGFKRLIEKIRAQWETFEV